MEPDPGSNLMICAIDLEFAATTIDDALQVLLSIVERTRAKAGCRMCSVARDAGPEPRLHYAEAWEAEAQFRRHLQSEEFRRVLVAVDLACAEPRVMIGSLAGRAGLDYVHELRARPAPDFT